MRNNEITNAGGDWIDVRCHVKHLISRAIVSKGYENGMEDSGHEGIKDGRMERFGISKGR